MNPPPGLGAVDVAGRIPWDASAREGGQEGSQSPALGRDGRSDLPPKQISTPHDRRSADDRTSPVSGKPESTSRSRPQDLRHPLCPASAHGERHKGLLKCSEHFGHAPERAPKREGGRAKSTRPNPVFSVGFPALTGRRAEIPLPGTALLPRRRASVFPAHPASRVPN